MSQFGRIVEIVSLRGDKLRGQAWVSFDTVEAATNAMAQFNGQPLFDKPMRITFAKSKSDIVSKKDGTFKPREKRAREEAPPARAAAWTAPAPPAVVSHRCRAAWLCCVHDWVFACYVGVFRR